jgi:hypothetical protein
MLRSRTSARLVAGIATISLAGVASIGSLAGAAAPSEVVFHFTGAPQHYVVPDGVCSVTVEALGAQGGGGSITTWFAWVSGGHTVFNLPEPGGLGARATSTISVTPGESLQVDVGGKGDVEGLVDDGASGFSTPHAGQGGWNGGGDGGTDANHRATAGGGGGASDVRQGGSGLDDRVVVAGGGGGSGAGSGIGTTATGGIGGNPATAGGDGGQTENDTFGNGNGSGFADPIPYGTGAGGGGGASTTAGGTGGTAGIFGSSVGEAGVVGVSGSGGHGANSTISGSGDLPYGGFSGGGGGGGAFGGGGGGSAAYDDAYAQSIDPQPSFELWHIVGAAGGGGSSLGTTTEAGVHEGDGQVTVTPISGDCHAPTVAPVSTAPTVVSKTTTAPAAPAAAVDAKPTYTG